jgi:hypothetical protein
VAAFLGGCRGLILPKDNLADITADDWPEREKGVPKEVVQRWPEVRSKMTFKGVGCVEELVCFFFPSLAERLRPPPVAPTPQSRKRARGRGGAAAANTRARGSSGNTFVTDQSREDVGPIRVSTVPLFSPTGDATMLWRVEACLVRGHKPPVRLPDLHCLSLGGALLGSFHRLSSVDKRCSGLVTHGR